MGIWAFVDVWLLAAAILSIVMSFVWRRPNLMLNFTLSSEQLTSGLILGILLMATFATSLLGIAQKGKAVWGLIVLNWMLILDGIAIIIVGSFLWFRTLEERNNYFHVFTSQPNQTIVDIQDKFSCCGYFANNVSVVHQGFCSNATINPNTTACVGPITAFTDMTLNNIFSTIYGYMAIVGCLFLATLCVIKERQEEERYKKIDSKRGFV